MKKTLLILLLFLSCIVRAQQDSCSLQISLLTCTPGEEIYSTFGHSAFRVRDTASNLDIIFNYGTFDFDDPGFSKKFIRGKLLYFVSVDSLYSFLREYEYFKRGVTEQVLNLNCLQKKQLVAALFENAKEENKYYLYDFAYDNCTTRLRDMLEEVTGMPLQTKNILPATSTTFRDLIHVYLNKGKQYWSKLGIDMLLGSSLDKTISNREAMFLPDYLMMALDSATIGNKPLVIEKRNILPALINTTSRTFFTPFTVLGIIFLLVAALSFFGHGVAKTFLNAFDVFFFMLTGLLGMLMLFMWFGTDHMMCRNNYNLLWALPTHFPLALMLFTKKNWVKEYFRFIFFYSLALLAAWFLLPQQFNMALLPVMGIIIVRSYFISKTLSRE